MLVGVARSFIEKFYLFIHWGGGQIQWELCLSLHYTGPDDSEFSHQAGQQVPLIHEPTCPPTHEPTCLPSPPGCLLFWPGLYIKRWK